MMKLLFKRSLAGMNLKAVSLLLVLSLCMANVHAQLSGSYKINSAQITAGQNFQDFTTLVNLLNTVGVNGPVEVNVAAGSGPYIETLRFETIPGASSANRIRINGNGTSVTFNNSAANRQLLTFDNAHYVTIDNLNFVSLNATYGWSALVTNGSSNDSIINCLFDLKSINAASPSSANANGIVFGSVEMDGSIGWGVGFG